MSDEATPSADKIEADVEASVQAAEVERNKIEMAMGDRRIIKRPAPEEAKALVAVNQQMMLFRSQIANIAIQQAGLEDAMKASISNNEKTIAQYKNFLDELQEKYNIKGRHGKTWAVDPSNGDILSMEPPAPRKELDESKKRKVAKVPIKPEGQ